MAKRNMMPPPGEKKPDLIVAVGTGKPKGDDAPPAPPTDPAATGGDDDADDDSKMDPSKALVSHADENCGNCQNYDPSTGDSSKVSGTYSPDDRCWSQYQAMSTDSGDMGDVSAGVAPDASAMAPAGAGM